MERVLNVFVESMFGPPLGVVNSDPPINEGRHMLYIGRQKVPFEVALSLTILGLLMVSHLSAIFWDIFLLEEYTGTTSICDDLVIDCFVHHDNNASATDMYDLVTNCTMYEDTDIEFICFKFVFSFGTALAAVGGLFQGLRIVIKIISLIALGFYRCIPNKQYCNCKIRNIFYTLFVIAAVLGGIAALAVYILLFSSPKDRVASGIKIGVIIVTFVLGATTPWQLLLPDESPSANIEKKCRESEGETQTLIGATTIKTSKS